jgi:RNA polymerase sigma factor (sigma-70 family)
MSTVVTMVTRRENPDMDDHGSHAPTGTKGRERKDAEASGQRSRELFFSLLGRYLPGLYHFVRRELRYREAAGDLVRGELTAEDVVDAVLLQAYSEFVTDHPARKLRRWLIQLARQHLAAQVRRRQAETVSTVHIEQDIPETPPQEYVSILGDEILDFYEPDEDLKLQDVVPDLKVPTPEQEAETSELRGCLEAALAGMPRTWRRALLLRHVDGLAGPTLARAIGRPEPVADRILDNARAYVRQRLVECGFQETASREQT